MNLGVALLTAGLAAPSTAVAVAGAMVTGGTLLASFAVMLAATVAAEPATA